MDDNVESPSVNVGDEWLSARVADGLVMLDASSSSILEIDRATLRAMSSRLPLAQATASALPPSLLRKHVVRSHPEPEEWATTNPASIAAHTSIRETYEYALQPDVERTRTRTRTGGGIGGRNASSPSPSPSPPAVLRGVLVHLPRGALLLQGSEAIANAFERQGHDGPIALGIVGEQVRFFARWWPRLSPALEVWNVSSSPSSSSSSSLNVDVAEAQTMAAMTTLIGQGWRLSRARPRDALV